MTDHGSNAAFAYHEPPIGSILSQTGFLIALNLVNFCLDRLIYCGLIGQLFVGILWGTPGAKWLDRETEAVIQQLGYLGLILLVYEGGLSTSIKSVRANLMVSLCVAITGIGVPMGLSFVLTELVGASPLQAFAAGASLSATSLGTTFTILSTTNLISTRLGIVTTSAAMLDDVVGLVMIQIISNLGGGASRFDALTVIRPVFVSIGFAVGLSLICASCIKPIFKRVRSANPNVPGFVGSMRFAFIYQTLLLVGIVAGATYAGTSSLFAAYSAGVIVTWLDGMIIEPNAPQETSTTDKNSKSPNASTNRPRNLATNSASRELQGLNACSSTHHDETPTGELVYERFYKQPVNRILTPLFFASIGFAIPITEMFKGNVVWRGIIYALLMILGKMITGVWLVRFSLHPPSSLSNPLKRSFSRIRPFCIPTRSDRKRTAKQSNAADPSNRPAEEPTGASNNQPNNQDPTTKRRESHSSRNPTDQTASHAEPQATISRQSSSTAFPQKPKSLYPPSILGLAMVARGEIGYLIASLAQSQGLFPSEPSGQSSEIYLIIIWAISICTLIGPVCVGTLVKRVKRLQESRTDHGPDPLGVWGI